MKKTKMSFKDILKKPYYKHILSMLLFFNDKNIGLRQYHFRYSLMRLPKLCEDSIKKIEDSIGDELKEFDNIYKRILKKIGEYPHNYKPIYSNQSLTNYLAILVDMKLVRKHGKHPNIEYRLTKKYFELFEIVVLQYKF